MRLWQKFKRGREGGRRQNAASVWLCRYDLMEGDEEDMTRLESATFLASTYTNSEASEERIPDGVPELTQAIFQQQSRARGKAVVW